MRGIQSGIDVLAHNVANVNTQGYKEKTVGFSNIVSSLGGETMHSGSTVSSINTNFKQGSLKTSSSNTDMSLNGSGFFVVQNAAGDIFYTRSGNFSFDSQASLVDAHGNYVLSVGGGRITIPTDATGYETNGAGEIMLKYGEGEYEYFDQLQLANFPNPAGLNSVGNNLYQESANSGSVEFGAAFEQGTSLAGTSVVAGTLEQSNVNMSDALINLIAMQRSYQAVSRTADTANGLVELTLSLVN